MQTTGWRGGGAGSAGSDCNTFGAGSGGSGLQYDISGTSKFYAAGGGGGGNINPRLGGKGGLGVVIVRYTN